MHAAQADLQSVELRRDLGVVQQAGDGVPQRGYARGREDLLAGARRFGQRSERAHPGHPDHLDIATESAADYRPVLLGDGSPVAAVLVDLRHRHHHGTGGLGSGPEELDLRCRQGSGAVTHHHDRPGAARGGQCQARVPWVQAAGARCVHQGETGKVQRVDGNHSLGGQRLDRGVEHVPATHRHPFRELVDRDHLIGIAEDQAGGAGRKRVVGWREPHARAGGDVDTDGCEVGPADERVHQGALAALHLTDEDHRSCRVRCVEAGLCQLGGLRLSVLAQRLGRSGQGFGRVGGGTCVHGHSRFDRVKGSVDGSVSLPITLPYPWVSATFIK